MAEYIEREAALNIARGTPAYYYLKNAPAAEVVEVVRCKDCSFYAEIEPPCEYNGHRAKMCYLNFKIKGQNGYCSEAIRRKENEKI